MDKLKHFCTLPVSGTARAKLKRISRRVASGTIATLLVASTILGVSGTASPKASAATTDFTPFCNQGIYSDLGAWDWVTPLRSLTGFSSWNLQDYSYVITGKNAANPGTTYQNYTIITFKDTTHQVHLFMDPTWEAANPTAPQNQEYDYTLPADTQTYYINIKTPATTGDTSNEAVTLLAGPANLYPSQHSDFGDANNACYYAIHNVVYDSSFTHYQYTDTKGVIGVGTGTSGGTSTPPTCQPLDITCYVNNAVSGVVNTFQGFFQSFLTALGALFVPNGTTLSSDWTTFHTTLTTKLGFLTWPFSFVGNLFTAITTPTTTCCVIGAGTFMGATFPGIDLAFGATHLPTLWTYTVAAIRGLTVLALFFMLRSKFLEITSR